MPQAEESRPGALKDARGPRVLNRRKENPDMSLSLNLPLTEEQRPTRQGHFSPAAFLRHAEPSHAVI